MKKALALILALIMLCSSVAVITAYAADDVAINIEEMPGYEKAYIGKPIETPPVQDGTIGDDEYTFSRKLYPYTPDKSSIADNMGSYINPTTEYWAYDADYIYYAYENNSIYASNSFITIRLEHDYVIGTNPKTFKPHQKLEDADAIRLTVGKGENNCSSDFTPTGKTAPEADDVASFHTFTSSYAYANVEFKISRAYLATQMGLDGASNVTKLTYSTFFQDTKWNGSSWVYIQLDQILSSDQIEWLEEKGVSSTLGYVDTSTASLARVCNMVVLGEDPSKINLVEFFEANGYESTYVGKALSADAPKPVQDGIVNPGEYQAQYLISKNYNRDAGNGTDNYNNQSDFTEYVAHDADWIYFAVTFSQAQTQRQFLWSVELIDSAIYRYTGGSTVSGAFKQHFGMTKGMSFNANIINENDPDTAYNLNSLSSASGTAPVENKDIYAKMVSVKNGDVYDKTYEFKLSKAWYAAQIGVATEDIDVVAWSTAAHQANIYGSSWTYYAHYLSDAELAALEARTGRSYTGAKNLPRFFVLDDAPANAGKAASDFWQEYNEKLGFNIHVQPVTKAPVLDGVISTDEYPTTRTLNVSDIYKGNGNGEIQGDTITEYFGHDAEYVYYALSFEQAKDGRYAWIQFKPDNSANVYNSYFDARSRYQACYSWTDERGASNWSNDIDATGGATWAAPVDEQDVFFAADKDRKTNIKTYEFKISKAYIATASGVGVSDVQVVPYYTYFHASCALGVVYTDTMVATLKEARAIRTTDSLGYYFMVLEGEYEDLHKVEDRLAINTQEEASIRLSPTNAGLRFKSIISTADLNTLKAKYDYIKVGTIIAPEDFDLTLQGILANNEKVAGTDYINVEANINNPIGHDKNINVFAGSITNLKENNIARNFAAVGYIAYSADGVNWTYVYSEVTAVRSAAQVAHLAIESGDYAEDATALEILNGYAAKYVPEAE